MRARTAVEVFVLLLSAGCARSAPTTADPSAPTIVVRVANDADAALPEKFEGIVIDVLPGVTYEARLVSSTGAQARQTATINGQPFVIDESRELRIGARSYGTLAVGDRVRITAEGVFRNDERLGPLPER